MDLSGEQHRRLQSKAESFGFSVRKRIVPALLEKGRVYYIVDTRNEVDSFGDFASLEETELFLNFLVGIRTERERRHLAA
ncbi:hypothetical protein FHS85_004770 [Rhodoligotrophos appendicifer]|uniref:hypothetical protein n=1 Tax=Rhodoligotrophos appendicifer TaxID=987056 RepID=UPI001186E3B9|nr:hypothetical protein [Rhodoligotrophos appendicifer]